MRRVVVLCILVTRAQLHGDLNDDYTVDADDIVLLVNDFLGVQIDALLREAAGLDENGVADARDISGFTPIGFTRFGDNVVHCLCSQAMNQTTQSRVTSAVFVATNPAIPTAFRVVIARHRHLPGFVVRTFTWLDRARMHSDTSF